jgi:hypothetical protein
MNSLPDFVKLAVASFFGLAAFINCRAVPTCPIRSTVREPPEFVLKVIFDVTVPGSTWLAESPVVFPEGAGITGLKTTRNVCDCPGAICTHDWLQSSGNGLSDPLEFTILSEKNLVSSGLVIRPLVTSLPVREIDNKSSPSTPQPVFGMAKNTEHSQLAGGFFLALRTGGTGVLPPKTMVMGCSLPGVEDLCTLTVKAHVDRLPEESCAAQVTVVVPRGKVEPDGGAQVAMVPGALSATVGGG